MMSEDRSLVSWLVDYWEGSLALVEIVPSVLIVIVSRLKIVLIIFLVGLNEKTEEVEFDLPPSENCCRAWWDNFGRMTSPQVTQLCSTLLRELGFGFLSRINALTISFSSTTSDETAGVEELVLTLARMPIAS
ncbi:hypothetical protein Tco_0551824 [Tanacetum coccineum]